MSYYDQLRGAAIRGELADLLHRTVAYYRSLPRWRIIRRLHVERQLMMLELAIECYECGNGMGWSECKEALDKRT